MNKIISLFCISTMLIAAPASAGPQQEKMKSCNKAAKTKSLKGDERKAFMKNCLRGKTDSATEPKPADVASTTKPSPRK